MAEVFEILGIPELITNLHRYQDSTFNKVASALYREGLRIIELAKLRVPVNTGALRDTGRVSDPVINGSEIYIILSFGDENVKYAVYVHERTWVRHIKGRSKYLESVLQEEDKNIMENIGDILRVA